MPSISETWRALQARLAMKNEVAPSEAKQMVKAVLGLDDIGLVLAENSDFPVEKASELEAMAARRIKGEPLAYILGFAWFYGRKWRVTPDVLIPRPDTEVLVEAALARIDTQTTDSIVVCEVGLGSGCVLGTLLAERPKVTGVGVEVSAAALEVAEENLKTVAAGVRWRSSCRDGLDGMEESFNLIVSNPPYISDTEWENLENGVKDFEPRTALSGVVPNGDGLVFYHRLAAWGCDKLTPGGWLCMEVGWQQAQAVRELLQQKGDAWHEVSVLKDLGGRERVVCARKTPDTRD